MWRGLILPAARMETSLLLVVPIFGVAWSGDVFTMYESGTLYFSGARLREAEIAAPSGRCRIQGRLGRFQDSDVSALMIPGLRSPALLLQRARGRSCSNSPQCFFSDSIVPAKQAV